VAAKASGMADPSWVTKGTWASRHAWAARVVGPAERQRATRAVWVVGAEGTTLGEGG
jgi:hypothetical protein